MIYYCGCMAYLRPFIVLWVCVLLAPSSAEHARKHHSVRRKYEYLRGETLRTDVQRSLALTFDDGPDPWWTPRILDILQEHGVKATFFVVGHLCMLSPHLVRRYADEGHTIGLHTWDHPNMLRLSSSAIVDQMDKSLQVLKSIVPHADIRLFRPPQGRLNKKVLQLVHSFDLSVVLWSRDTEDWKTTTGARDIAQSIGRANDGSIILLHDGVDAADQLHALGIRNETSGFEGITRTDKQNVVDFLRDNLAEMKKRYHFMPITP